MRKLWKFSFFVLFLLCFFTLPDATPVGSTSRNVKLPIIMYHKISTRTQSLGKYTISPDELEKDIRLILKKGFTPINITDLENYAKGEGTLPAKPIMLTFDDGHLSDFVYAFPLAQKYNVKIVCSPVASYVEEYSKGSDHNVNYAYLTWENMLEMEKSGFVEFQNHSFNLHNFNSLRHGCLKNSSESTADYVNLILSDLNQAQDLFVQNGLKAPTCFTYPYGMRDDLLLEQVKKAGFTATLGTYERINLFDGNLYDLCRFNRAHNYNINKILNSAE